MEEAMKYALAIAASAAAMFAYMYEAPPDRVVQEVGQAAPSLLPPTKPQQKRPSLTVLKDLVDNLETEAAKDALIQEWVNEYGAEYERQRLAQQAADIAEYEQRNVQPYNPAYVSCVDSEVLDEQGKTRIKRDCKSSYNLPRHPYYSWSSEDLATVAYSEPLAAQILAKRIAAHQPEEALNLLLHASAVSSKTGPILVAAHNVYNPFRYTSGVKSETAHLHVALLRVARAMGSTFFGAEEPSFSKHNFQIDEAAVRRIETNLKNKLAQTQLTVTGNPHLRELFNDV